MEHAPKGVDGKRHDIRITVDSPEPFAQKSEDGTFRGGKCDAIDGGEMAEAFGQIFAGDHGGNRHT